MSLFGEASTLPPPRRRERLEFALPTINVIFLLMLYFLMAGTIVQQDEMSVAPPETAQAPTDRLPRPLLLIANSGEFFLDGRALTRDALVEAAVAVTSGAEASSDQLNILAPAEMPAAPFLELLAAFSAAGVPVRLVTVEAEEGEEGP